MAFAAAKNAATNGEAQEGRHEQPPASLPFSERKQRTAAVGEDQGLGEISIEGQLCDSPEPCFAGCALVFLTCG